MLGTPHFIISRVNQIDPNRSERNFVITISVPHEDSLFLAFGNIVTRVLALEELSAGLLESITMHVMLDAAPGSLRTAEKRRRPAEYSHNLSSF